ncbi:MAG: N-acetylmuramoyl-L-alanine amidase [Anaerolineales bacterium]|nr:N-acetylmuramoyl-L-alanine amidase [Anaerolineales bacterium]
MKSQEGQMSVDNPAAETQRGTIYVLQVVLTVAFVVATLFTAWTPADLLPGSLNEILAFALAPSPESPLVDYPTPTPLPHPRIGIVAGHWGNDPGAVCPDGLTEVEVNLNVATKVKENLLALEFEVDLLKEFDPKLSVYQAMTLISIHADSCNYINDQATGFKISSALSSSFPDKAARLNACLRNRYETITGLQFHANSVTPDMTYYHAFDEIHPDTVAAIIEIGFLNLDRQILTQQPDIIAKGISDGILCYIYNEDISPAEEQ